MLALSYALADVAQSRSEFVPAAMSELRKFLPSESVGWFQIRLATGESVVDSDPPEHASSETAERFQRFIGTHPTTLDWLSRPDDDCPRRLTDLTTLLAFRNTPAYNEVYRPIGVLQNLTFLTRPLAGGVMSGWSFCRQGRDFTDDELDSCYQVQATLAALEMLQPDPWTALQDHQAALTSADRQGLTDRELDMLELVGRGMTAVQIGRVRRISPRTVRKHLENTYAKLGCHDRLLAVDTARRLGLIPPLIPAQPISDC